MQGRIGSYFFSNLGLTQPFNFDIDGVYICVDVIFIYLKNRFKVPA